MLARLAEWFHNGRISDAEFLRQRKRLLQDVLAPVFWLLGKTGSGKTSVVRYLTGIEHAEVGNGFRPQTSRSRQFDFPAAENPLVHFIDTRGLGERRYDPTEDLVRFHDQAHLVVVTVRLLDHALADLVNPLRQIRAAEPDRPVVLLLTRLHEAYPREQHPDPDPFREATIPAGVPAELKSSLQRQLERFDGLFDRAVPIDLTRPEEGFAEPNFGGQRLKSTLLEMLPAAHRQTLLSLDEAMKTLKDLNERRAMPQVIGHCTLAATAAAVPIPWVDIPFVFAVQAHLVYRLASIYGQSVNAASFFKTAGPIGAQLLSRLALRSTAKLVPVAGAAANATLAYACTYALGRVCCWYFGQVRKGNAPAEAEIERAWQDQLEQAWSTNRPHSPSTDR